MKLEIKKYNEDILRKKSEGVKEITSDIKELVFNMIETMKKENGIGLAGPQIGVLKRIIVVQINPNSSKTIALINPEIIKKSSQKEKRDEGCLSFPGIFLEIKRPKEVEIKALDIKGKEINIKTEGLLARVLQHEIDHLDGILFFNRLSFWKKLKFYLKNPKIS